MDNVMKRKPVILIVVVFSIIVLAVALFKIFYFHIVSLVLDIPAPEYSVVVNKDIMVPMRDGTLLATDIYRPDTNGSYPLIITRTPYGKDNPEHKYSFAGKLFASQGYVFLCQDVRGKFNSEGDFYPYLNEAIDGYDTVKWASAQNWSSGKTGTYGFSYWGSTQWLSAPVAGNSFDAMVPIVTSQNIYNRWVYNGIYRINDILCWHYTHAPKVSRDADIINWSEAVKHLPLIEADDALGHDISHYNDWLLHPSPDSYWDSMNVEDRVSSITAPALIIDGWYDYYLDYAIEDYNRMAKRSGSVKARKSMLVIGPWIHTSGSKFDDVDFGKESGFMQNVKLILSWYNHWLKNMDNDITDEGPIKIFVMGINQWRSENEWPLARTRFTRYYLHSNGKAATTLTDGLLSSESPGAQPADNYTYDPKDPVPSIGGTSIYGDAVAGPADQAEIESRDDVLVYSTPPLKNDLEITGPIKLVFFASSNTRDTDFFATLTDVYPDGKSINLKTGGIRARFRNSLHREDFLTPGRVYKIELEVGATSNVFKKGHRIRLQVSSSRFPEFSRNLNTGEPIGMSADMVKADLTVLHDDSYPSHLVLPVIPKKE